MPRTLPAAICALALLAPSFQSQAAEKPACEQFAWPLTREQAWFKVGDLKSVANGASLPALSQGAFVLNLEPASKVPFVLAPERPPKNKDASGALVSFAAVEHPGTYQVTLSEEAWIDMIQDKHYVPSAAFTGKPGCPGLRKSVRFVLSQQPVVLQLSGATASTISVAIGAVE